LIGLASDRRKTLDVVQDVSLAGRGGVKGDACDRLAVCAISRPRIEASGAHVADTASIEVKH
jgi:hypothetical protein